MNSCWCIDPHHGLEACFVLLVVIMPWVVWVQLRVKVNKEEDPHLVIELLFQSIHVKPLLCTVHRRCLLVMRNQLYLFLGISLQLLPDLRALSFPGNFSTTTIRLESWHDFATRFLNYIQRLNTICIHNTRSVTQLKTRLVCISPTNEQKVRCAFTKSLPKPHNRFVLRNRWSIFSLLITSTL